VLYIPLAGFSVVPFSKESVLSGISEDLEK